MNRRQRLEQELEGLEHQMPPISEQRPGDKRLEALDDKIRSVIREQRKLKDEEETDNAYWHFMS